jgi:hypothetical protein
MTGYPAFARCSTVVRSLGPGRELLVTETTRLYPEAVARHVE